MPAMVGGSSFKGTPVPSDQKERSHMYPSSALPAWQLLLIMVVPAALLVTWIIVVRLAGREPRGCSCPAASTVIGVRAAEGAAAEEHVRADQSGDQRAA
jgi:hypothetical protein